MICIDWPFVQRMLNSWKQVTELIIPEDCDHLVTVSLEAGSSLQWRNWWRDRRLGSLNIIVGLEGLKFPKTNLLVRVIKVMYKDSLYMMNTPWFYAVHQH